MSTQPFVKRLSFDAKHRSGEPTVIQVPSDHEKIAASLHPDILTWLNDNPKPDDRHRVIVTALGGFEGYGANVNGDGFHEDHLLRTPEDVSLNGKPYDQPIYRTFVDFSKLFRHHQNKPHDQTYGELPHAIYNDGMRRVEVVADIYDDHKLNADVLNDLEDNIFPSVSMGYRCVPGDVCSLCANYDNPFPHRGKYCNHLKRNMLEYDPKTGRLIYAINHNGYFFDLSLVSKPADRIAWGMKKVASGITVPENFEYSEDAAARDGSLEKVASMESEKHVVVEQDEKSAIHDKEVPAEVEAVVKEDPDPAFRAKGVKLIYRTDKPIPPEVLDRLAEQFPLGEICATLAGAGILPSPEEFQRLVLVAGGKRDQAEAMQAQNLVFDPTMEVEPDPSLDVSKHAMNKRAGLLLASEGVIDDRSYFAPFLAKRAGVIKEAIDIGEFFDRYPIVERPNPTRKVDAETLGVTPGAPAVGGPPTGRGYVIGGGGKYVPPKPADATVRHRANPIIPLATLAALYGGANWMQNLGKKHPLSRLALENPLQAMAIFGGTAALSWLGANAGIPRPTTRPTMPDRAEKTSASAKDWIADYLLHMLGGIGTSYAIAGRAENKREIGVQPNVVEEAYEKRPLLGSLLTAGALAGAGKAIASKMAADKEQLDQFHDMVLTKEGYISFYPLTYIDNMSRRSLVKSARTLGL